MCLHFKNNSPCSSCPYRKDAKLKLWDKSEYEKLIESNKNVMSPIYACHKNNLVTSQTQMDLK